MNGRLPAGQAARASKGWWRAKQWLLLRRLSQFGILFLFLLGPWFGIWIVKGNLASSLTLEVLPLSDPYVIVQSFLAGQLAASTSLLGAAIVSLFYILVGGRAYCAWVCPVNIVTDAAAWLRRKLDIKGGARLSRRSRYWMLGLTLLLALLSGTLVWELVNPVSLLHRGIIFGMGFGWFLILALLLFDLFVARHGWCGHLCPVGAFYSLLAVPGVIRVSAAAREKCDDCMDCFAVCPEQQVIRPALKGAAQGIGPVILSPNCTNCGRCIDVCAREVFRFSTRFSKSTDSTDSSLRIQENKEATS